MRLNTDEAVSKTRKATCGGLIKDSTRGWLGGFSKNIGTCEGTVADLWGVFEGLKLVREKGYTKVEL